MSREDRDSVDPRVSRLVELIARLRGPDGCPWDRDQTHESLKPMIIEEAYELVEAIDEGGGEELVSELGDVLLQVVFHAQVAAEADSFTLADVVDGVCAKMVRRHPHVFADEQAGTPREVLRSWEAIKAAEIAARNEGGHDRGSMLDAVSSSLPGVLEAYQITTKASRVGFDWPDTASVLDKLHEEIAEYQAAASRGGESHRELSEELGDLLFVAVNLARLHGVDPESALKTANRKFRRRFRHIEDRLAAQGRAPAESTLDEMDALWDEAKREERGEATSDPGE
jgi:tetrapyrrole methylase family protein/MazG family protein/ATP diphosphatase